MKSKAHIKTHPLHPMLVVFPLAFFTGALLFDLIAFFGRYHFFHAIAFYLSIAGITGGVLAAIAGVIDLVSTVPPQSSAKNRGVMHGLFNSVVLILFVVIVILRREGFGWMELCLEVIAVAIMIRAGWMGGTLVHRNQIGIDHRYANAGKWNEQRFKNPVFPLEVADAGELTADQMKLLHVASKRIVLARTETGFVAFDDRCTHRGASLADGVLICGTVQCPWHGSQFTVETGRCVKGPGKEDIKIYKVTESKGKVWLGDISG